MTLYNINQAYKQYLQDVEASAKATQECVATIKRGR
jgi:hypothetical protein